MSNSPHLAEPALNATPLIDVLLVLLIMLIFTVPVATHLVKLDLPVGPPGKSPPKVVRLEILYPDDIWWNGEYVATLDDLAPKFASIASQTNSPGGQAPLLQVWADRMAPPSIAAEIARWASAR